jgi:alanine racemase
MVMVKAAAYGSGSDEVARLLEFQQVDYLAVAFADEGVELRKAGITLPIMVLNPEQATFDLLQQFNLEPEIYSQYLLEQLLRYFPEHQSLRIHLKLDTGMHRLGFEESDLNLLIQTLRVNPHLEVASIFSHLAASDESDQDAFTETQIEKFHTYYEQITRDLGYRPLKHILNTNGIIRFPQYQYDMVRLGIGLYGIGTNPPYGSSLETVLSLKATISQIKTVPAGETIGYSRKGIAKKNMRIATISIGYADGLLRKAGNGRFAVKIHGKPAPTVGNICMDMTMVDISDIPEASAGDEVSIFGNPDNYRDQPVEILADCYGSLVYEVLTGISERVKRVYFQE